MSVNMTLLDIHDPMYNPMLDRKNRFRFVPNEAAAICFMASFAVLTVLHIVLTINSRIWWLFAMAVGGAGEVVGWYGRLSGAHNPRQLVPFLLQQVCLALSPVFFSGVCYALFTKLVFLINPAKLRFNPTLLTPLFVACDILCLTIQAIGGGKSGAAASSNKPNAGDVAKQGRYIYLAGVATQLVVMIAFSSLALDYANRIRRSRMPSYVWTTAGGKRTKIAICGVAIASFLIIFRNVFRTVELADGFYGHIAVTEAYFTTLDALPMAMCMMILLLTHPAFTLAIVSERNFSEAINPPDADSRDGRSPADDSDPDLKARADYEKKIYDQSTVRSLSYNQRKPLRDDGSDASRSPSARHQRSLSQRAPYERTNSDQGPYHLSPAARPAFSVRRPRQ